ncbi:MAG: sigma-54-dependent Fis family transcriptional regulator [Bdellovibrionales bacterium]|nr:sigma-54-dependent Fis family transcriptional regulator [Bdellovibrionales bacterium]
MTPKPKTIFYLDDEAENLNTLSRMLRGHYQVRSSQSAKEALSMLKSEPSDVVISDQRMPNMTGVEFLKEAIRNKYATVGILLTAYSDLDALVDAVNHNVIFRYLTKPIQEYDLLHALDQAFQKVDLVNENLRLIQRLEEANLYLKEEINETHGLGKFQENTDGLKSIMKLLRKVAPTNTSVLIRGETGVGKELVARTIHEMSPRSKQPFIRVNCAALPENLLESELFGHEKGSFTGATHRRMGRFEAAHQGTLFLDEIGDISGKLQVNLLRVLQEKEFERVGSHETIKTDVRIIAATHQNLEQKISENLFREDLFFRLNVFPIVIPPLRNRIGDLKNLAQDLLLKVAKKSGTKNRPLSKDALDKLTHYDWPGNVRELENVLERALILATSNVIEPEDIILDTHIDTPSSSESLTQEITKELLEQTLFEVNGNKVEAAKKLGLKRPTLYYHLKRLGISS